MMQERNGMQGGQWRHDAQTEERPGEGLRVRHSAEPRVAPRQPYAPVAIAVRVRYAMLALPQSQVQRRDNGPQKARYARRYMLFCVRRSVVRVLRESSRKSGSHDDDGVERVIPRCHGGKCCASVVRYAAVMKFSLVSGARRR